MKLTGKGAVAACRCTRDAFDIVRSGWETRRVGVGAGIGVLGPASIEGASLGGRDRKVLAVLVLDAPHWVGPGRLADALWAQDPPASSAKVVQGAVSRLRRVLRPDAIVSGPGGYRLDVPPDVIDVRRFESVVE